MRTLTCTLVMLLLSLSVNLAQDVPAPAKEVDNATLLKDYLGAKGKEKNALREKLLALTPDQLRKAIDGLTYDGVVTGVQEWTTQCPDGFERPYWVYVPEGYNPAKRYPLLVCLHGGVSGQPLRGERFNPGEYSIEYWLPHMTDEQKKEVVILGCSAGVPETGMEAAWWHLKGQNNVLHMIRETKRRVNIDDDRVIVNGHSDGGSGSFGFAYRQPDAFAGFFAMNGHPMVAQADGTPVWLENLKGLNIRAFNGGKDGLYPAKRTTPIYDQANELGANIDHTTYPDLDHQVGDVLEDEVAGFFDDELTRWNRDLLPAEIDWACTGAERGRRAWLHIDEIGELGSANIAPVNAEINVPAGRPRLGITVERQVEKPTVETVQKGSTAADMGIEEGDVITKLDDHVIATMQDLLDALDTKAAGDDVTIEVERAGKAETLKGKFAANQQQELEVRGPVVARVIAKLDKPGQISLTVRNAKKVTLYAAQSMLDAEGKLRVRLNPGDDSQELKIVRTETVVPSSAFMLDEFERTHDRRLPWVAKFEVNVAGLLGVKVKPADPKKKEDEF
ncbi:MAG: PDZ domain-containing protein [Planctomycetes bacterium]|nr:PDZ domain-containing protein [Planctomycetota bacterium]